MPAVGEPLEIVLAQVREQKTGTRNEIPYGRGRHDFARTCERGAPGCRMYRDPGDATLPRLDLARVQPAADRDTDRPHGLAPFVRTPDSPGWAVEPDEH